MLRIELSIGCDVRVDSGHVDRLQGYNETGVDPSISPN